MWRDELDRYHGVRLVTAGRLPAWSGGAALLARPGELTIVLGDHLVEADLEAAVLHELAHAERRLAGTLATTPAREERAVNERVVRVLLDLGALERWCRAMADVTGGVTPEDVAAAFDVAVWVARLGLELLADTGNQGRSPSGP